MGDKDNDSEASLEATIAEEAKATILEIYKDVAKPSTVQIGNTLGRVFRLFLTPLNSILENGIQRLQSGVNNKASNSASKRITQPPANIAAPVAFHYSLLGDGEGTNELRDMFENLLLSSMEEEHAGSAHPSFVSIISQLTQDEAWILKSINCAKYHYIQDVENRAFCTMLGADTGINESRIEFYIANLVRLGILALHTGLAGDVAQAPPALADRFARMFPNVPLQLASLLFMHVTPFGVDFLATCTRVKIDDDIYHAYESD